MRIALITLGCPKNLVDTEVMLGRLAEAGHEFTDEPAGSDVVIVNTCSFISAAVQESREVIEGCLELKASGETGRVVVAGCLPQRYGAATVEMFPDVDGVVGCSAFEFIDRVVDAVADGESVLDVGPADALYDEGSPRVLGTPDHIAYVKIADGCENCCSYCTIPSIRGALRSRPIASIVAEVTDLIASGVMEINLIAQDTTAYGTDIAPDVTLATLLSALDYTNAPWVRVLYTHPAHVTEELLSMIAGSRSVVPYLDIPIQHVSDRILGAMGRHTDGARVRRVLGHVRESIPDVSIRSSVIVGFPGETEEEFRELLAFIQGGAVDHLGVFEYSPEPGTPAFDLPDRVDGPTTSRRARTLVETMEELAGARARTAVDTIVKVLVDESGDESRPAVARTPGQAWEMDGVVLLSPGITARPGTFERARVTGASGFDLLAEKVPD